MLLRLRRGLGATCLAFSALLAAFGLGALLTGCPGPSVHRAVAPTPEAPRSAAPILPQGRESFGFAEPEDEGMDSVPLRDLARWVVTTETHLYSLLISRWGKVVFELYTSEIDRRAAHYVMSVTKSVLATLVAIAIERGLLASVDQSVAELLPEESFGSPERRERWRDVTVKHLLGMSALDASGPPFDRRPASVARWEGYLRAPDRLRYALEQPLVAEPGTSFVYSDIGPTIVSGIVAHAAHDSAFGFAEKALFAPLGFEAYEWMHRDAVGTDNGGYGLRLRPIDMQKLGVLYLDHGLWNGRRIFGATWDQTAFDPWNKSERSLPRPNYGWFWWRIPHRRWTAHEAIGWRGQRIAVFPEEGLVVTTTGYMTDDEERSLKTRLVDDWIVPSVEHGPRLAVEERPRVHAELAQAIADAKHAQRTPPAAEPRMLPQIGRKGPDRRPQP